MISERGKTKSDRAKSLISAEKNDRNPSGSTSKDSSRFTEPTAIGGVFCDRLGSSSRTGIKYGGGAGSTGHARPLGSDLVTQMCCGIGLADSKASSDHCPTGFSTVAKSLDFFLPAADPRVYSYPLITCSCTPLVECSGSKRIISIGVPINRNWVRALLAGLDLCRCFPLSSAFP